MTPYEQPSESNRFAYRYEVARSWLAEHRSVAALVSMLVLMAAFGAGFKSAAKNTKWVETALHLAQPGAGLPIDFAPEVWLALVAMVLGTLIIVISISSQSTPKLIDLYMRDWLSLAYLWFMLLAMIQNIYLQNGTITDIDSRLAAFLNTYIYLPLALALAMPYVFYILANTKTSRVIQRIHADNLGRLTLLTDPMTRDALEDPRIARNYQLQLFESFNQFDDLLQYTSFKEPKALIMARIGSALRKYVAIKPEIPASFFQVSPEAMEDISFLTIKDQRKQIEAARSFYELKGFRILTNQFAKLIEVDAFDLASLCAAQFVEVARAAGRTKLEEGLLEIITIQFNTLMRYAINHGVKNSESRHIYNLLFFYRQFILESAAAGHVEIVEEGCNYLKLYSTEIYRHSLTIPAFKFLVDVCVAEMRTILQYISISKWPAKDQRHVLDMMLTMDDAPPSQTILPGATPARSIGVRVIQLGLALFYIKRGQNKLVAAILEDFIGPTTRTEIQDLTSLMWTIVNRIQTEPETFWEVTDRGNRNIYHCPYTDAIPELTDRFQQELAQIYTPAEVHKFDTATNGDVEEIPATQQPVDPGPGAYRLRRR
jgi:hypothetical protein